MWRNILRIGLMVSLFMLLVSVVSAQEQRTHTVKRGESLQSIATLYNTSVESIAVANHIIDPNRIRAGQVLVIPTTITSPRTHTVKAGERLSDIATRYNTTVEALLQANSFSNPNTIIVGQVLNLPATGGPVNYSRTHVIDTGETLRTIAERYGTTWQVLAAYNNIANPNYVQAGQHIVIPPAGTVVTPPPVVVQPQPQPQLTYTVRQGDTLSAIAVRFNVTIESLVMLNGITNNRNIFAGQVLRIPPTGGPVVNPPVVIPGRHIVGAGETMFAISRRYGVDVYAIARANGILNLNQIYVGQSLVIPR